MKYPTASSAEGGGGTNVRVAPAVSGKGGGMAKGTMGTMGAKPMAKGCMGTGSAGPASCKGTMGKG